MSPKMSDLDYNDLYLFVSREMFSHSSTENVKVSRLVAGEHRGGTQTQTMSEAGNNVMIQWYLLLR